eukprot:1426812-Amphidinium_carterae.1
MLSPGQTVPARALSHLWLKLESASVGTMKSSHNHHGFNSDSSHCTQDHERQPKGQARDQENQQAESDGQAGYFIAASAGNPKSIQYQPEN